MAKPDPSTFPAPHKWATHLASRSPQFKTHKTVGQAKNAVGYNSYGGGTQTDAWVYEWNTEDEAWVEYAFIPKGSITTQHPLWQKPAKRGRAVSDKQVDKAIASILKTAKKP